MLLILVSFTPPARLFSPLPLPALQSKTPLPNLSGEALSKDHATLCWSGVNAHPSQFHSATDYWMYRETMGGYTDCSPGPMAITRNAYFTPVCNPVIVHVGSVMVLETHWLSLVTAPMVNWCMYTRAPFTFRGYSLNGGKQSWLHHNPAFSFSHLIFHSRFQFFAYRMQ